MSIEGDKEADIDRLIECGFLGDRDPYFRAYVEQMPDTHWAKYDLSAVRLGWEAHKVLHTNMQATSNGRISNHMRDYNGRNGNGYQPRPIDSGKVPQPPRGDSLSLKGWQQENAELQDEVLRLRKAAEDWHDAAVISERNRYCGRHKHRVAHFCEECFTEVMAERDRLLVLATKHCPLDHHDFQEILRIGGDA